MGYKERGLSIFASTSFQTHSIPMLHLISRIDNSIPIYFIDTGFHFPETISYRQEITKLLDLNIQIVGSQISKIDLLGKSNKFLYTTDPNYCCELNKVNPLNAVTTKYDVWITGVRKDQNSNRQEFNYEAIGVNNITRFHPMLNWDEKMINTYLSRNNIPSHPLTLEGYKSVGCAPCTVKPVFDERSGRWRGMHKTECGLHLGVK